MKNGAKQPMQRMADGKLNITKDLEHQMIKKQKSILKI